MAFPNCGSVFSLQVSFNSFETAFPLLTLAFEAAGLLYFHMAKILLLEEHIQPQDPNLLEDRHEHESCIEQLHHHSRGIASICFSPGVRDGVLVVAVNPLYYGKRNSW